MRGIYQTKQREAILNCLRAHGGQSLLAKDVAELCRNAGVPVGMATIYRHLEYLVAEHQVKKITTDGHAGIRYQYLHEEPDAGTFFLNCDCCGTMTPTDCHLLADVAEHMDEAHGFRLDPARTVLYGRCNDCKKKGTP